MYKTWWTHFVWWMKAAQFLSRSRHTSNSYSLSIDCRYYSSWVLVTACCKACDLTIPHTGTQNYKPNHAQPNRCRRYVDICLEHNAYFLFLTVFISVCPCLPVSTRVCQCLPVSARVCPCLPVSARVCPCLPVSARVCPCLPVLARVCPCLPVSARVCPCLPVSARVCPCLPVSARVCPCLPVLARVCPCLPVSARVCPCLPVSARVCPCLPMLPFPPPDVRWAAAGLLSLPAADVESICAAGQHCHSNCLTAQGAWLSHCHHWPPSGLTTGSDDSLSWSQYSVHAQPVVSYCQQVIRFSPGPSSNYMFSLVLLEANSDLLDLLCLSLRHVNTHCCINKSFVVNLCTIITVVGLCGFKGLDEDMLFNYEADNIDKKVHAFFSVSEWGTW